MLFVAISKAALFRIKTPSCYRASGDRSPPQTLVLPWDPGAKLFVCPIAAGRGWRHNSCAQGMGRPWRPAFFLEVTPYVRRDTGFIDSLNRVKLSSSCITHSWPIPAGGKSGEADVYSPTPQLFSFEQMTPLSNTAVNCLNKCKVQIAAKNLSHLPKKLQNTSVFRKARLCSSLAREATRCQEPVRGADAEGLWFSPRQDQGWLCCYCS